MSPQNTNWEKTISVNILALKITGIWPENLYNLDFYTLYTTLLITLQLSVFILGVLKLYYTTGDLDLFFDILVYLIAHGLYSVKIWSVAFNFRSLHDMVATLRGPDFQPKGPKQQDTMARKLRVWWNLYRFFITSVSLTAILFITIPFFNGGYLRALLPTPIVCPLSCKRPLNYIVVYAFESVAITSLCMGAFNVDMLEIAFFVGIDIQCELICQNLRHLGQDFRSFRRDLLRCVRHHQQLLKFVAKFNKFSNIILFFQFFLSTLLLSILVFQGNGMAPGSFIFYSRLGAGVSYVFQIFAYCWYGAKIELKSLKISRSIFESLWLEESDAVKKLLLIFATNCQKPVKISAFGLFYLSLEVFVKIMKSAWSFLMILQQVTTD